jgi:hypothetical protein
MNRIEHRLRLSTDHVTKPKRVYDRISPEQRGYSQTGAKYNRLVVMVDESSEYERVFSLLT